MAAMRAPCRSAHIWTAITWGCPKFGRCPGKHPAAMSRARWSDYRQSTMMNLGRSPEPTGISSFASDEELRSNGLTAGVSAFRVERWNSVRQRRRRILQPQFAPAIEAASPMVSSSPSWRKQTVASTTPQLEAGANASALDTSPAAIEARTAQRRLARQQRQIRWLTIGLVVVVLTATVGIANRCRSIEDGDSPSKNPAASVEGQDSSEREVRSGERPACRRRSPTTSRSHSHETLTPTSAPKENPVREPDPQIGPTTLVRRSCSRRLPGRPLHSDRIQSYDDSRSSCLRAWQLTASPCRSPNGGGTPDKSKPPTGAENCDCSSSFVTASDADWPVELKHPESPPPFGLRHGDAVSCQPLSNLSASS